MRVAICGLGLVDILTKRAAEGIAECEHALELDRNLAGAHAIIGLGKIFIGRAEETEAHIAEALRLSPRDTMAYIWMTIRGHGEAPPRQLRASGRVVSTGDRGQPKLSASIFCIWPPPSRSLVDLTRRVPPSRPVSRSTRPSPSPAPAPPGRRGATTRRIWPSLSPFSKACARPESPNNDRRPPPRRDPRRRRRRARASGWHVRKPRQRRSVPRRSIPPI